MDNIKFLKGKKKHDYKMNSYSSDVRKFQIYINVSQFIFQTKFITSYKQRRAKGMRYNLKIC